LNKALTSVIAAAALVTLAVPAAQATSDRSLPTKISHVKITKAAKVAKHRARRGRVGSKSNASSTTNDSSASASAPTEEQLCELGYYCIPLGPTPTTDRSVAPRIQPTYNDGAGT
jgi:hypothetical protein